MRPADWETGKVKIPRAQSIHCLHETQPNLHVQGAAGVVDVILGKRTPSGRLPVTFYHSNYTDQVRPCADIGEALTQGSLEVSGAESLLSAEC